MSAATDHSAPRIQPYRTGLRPEILGLIIFLVSEAALFGAFFMYYANLRVLNGIAWPGEFDIPAEATSINTLILVLSSFTCEFALLSLYKRKNGAVFAWLLATFILGAIFLGLQVEELYPAGRGDGRHLLHPDRSPRRTRLHWSGAAAVGHDSSAGWALVAGTSQWAVGDQYLLAFRGYRLGASLHRRVLPTEQLTLG